MSIAIVTGSSGLIGSETVKFLHEKGMTVHGIDNNLREYFFGADGSVQWKTDELVESLADFTHLSIDVRDGDETAASISERFPPLTRRLSEVDRRMVSSTTRMPRSKSFLGRTGHSSRAWSRPRPSAVAAATTRHQTMAPRATSSASTLRRWFSRRAEDGRSAK